MQSCLGSDLTVQEALDILFCQEDNEAPTTDTIYTGPPEPAIESDEDSGDEDGGGTSDNLNRRQLTGQVEIRYNDVRDVEIFEAVLRGRGFPALLNLFLKLFPFSALISINAFR